MRCGRPSMQRRFTSGLNLLRRSFVSESSTLFFFLATVGAGRGERREESSRSSARPRASARRCRVHIAPSTCGRPPSVGTAPFAPACRSLPSTRLQDWPCDRSTPLRCHMRFRCVPAHSFMPLCEPGVAENASVRKLQRHLQAHFASCFNSRQRLGALRIDIDDIDCSDFHQRWRYLRSAFNATQPFHVGRACRLTRAIGRDRRDCSATTRAPVGGPICSVTHGNR